jgi:hypothetical protein
VLRVSYCLLVLAAGLLASSAAHTAATPSPVPAGAPAIVVEPSEVESHTRFLADDRLEGREAGSRGDRLAQAYIAGRMRAAGLRPAGDAGSFLQAFRMRTTTLVPDSVEFELLGSAGTRKFANGGEIVVFGSPLEASQQLEAPLLFAGYGISAPGLGIDDYAGLDARGRIVVVLGGPPPFLPPAEAAHHGSSDRQRLTAEAHGAVGVIQLWTPALETRFPWRGMVGLLGRKDMAWIGSDGVAKVTAPAIRLRAFAHGEAAEALLDGSGRRLKDLLEEGRTRSPRGFPLGGRIRFAARSSHDDTRSSANVLGLLPGSDPKLAGELVVLTAHYDHLGIGPAVKGDTIYNGALDNAIGTAGLLEAARLIASAPDRPKRSILFAAIGAEEKGLIGSDYLADRSAAARQDPVAVINLDGIMPFYDFSDVIAFGAEQSQLGELLAAAAGELGLVVAPDPFPEEGIFTRSDHYSFVKRGVPALFVYVGFTNLQGRSVGRRYWDDLNATIVHQPGDDLAQPIDYSIAAKFTDLFRRLVLRTANAPARPLWYRGSSFGSQFAPTSPKAERPTR